MPMPIMIWIAVIIEAAIQNWVDMGILLAIQFINATIGWYENRESGRRGGRAQKVAQTARDRQARRRVGQH